MEAGPTGYFEVADPKTTIELSTIGDFTFFTNKDVVVEQLTDTVPDNPPIAIVYCQFATYSRDYIVKIDGSVVGRYTTADSSVAANELDIRTNNIVEKLAAQIAKEVVTESLVSNYDLLWHRVVTTHDVVEIFSVVNLDTGEAVTNYSLVGDREIRIPDVTPIGGVNIEVRYTAVGFGSSDYTTEVSGNVMYLKRNDLAGFEVDTVDSADGKDLIAIQDRVSSVASLPPKAPDNYTIKVQNQVGFDANSYWLKAVPIDEEDQTGSEVRWEESGAQGSLYKFNTETMPYVLISEADGTFTFRKGEWEDREVGNDDSNPFPSFLGSTISTLGSFQNRTLITAGEAAVFGRTNSFFNLFRESTQVVAASDPIDIFADSDEVNKLHL